MRMVKLFNDQKGLCFITPNDGVDEIFINQSAIRSDGFRSLVDGEVADFDMEPGMLVALRRSMISALMVLLSKEYLVMVEVVDVITIVVVG
ncbi:hypothetical protein MTR67_007153 [Solanum verrucosum]|uniref:CSD domain-containing protein n=1 Tax=Solanum verrucosum TaxID=315347 RepID=A0AAF0PZ86_SOLVR|nr:hypothetical protein MTR67_007153 [Solanum verrucosum]